MTELPIERVLLETVAHIERLGIPYAVMGGFAARAWGLPRPTFDADIAIAVDRERLQSLFEALEEDGFDVPPEHRSGFLDNLGGFKKAKVNRFVESHVWSTDLFVVEGGLLTSAMRRARPMTIASRSVRVMAPEDIILLKLIAARRKDLADVEEIIALCPALDLAYVREWAAKLDLQKRLDEFL